MPMTKKGTLLSSAAMSAWSRVMPPETLPNSSPSERKTTALRGCSRASARPADCAVARRGGVAAGLEGVDGSGELGLVVGGGDEGLDAVGEDDECHAVVGLEGVDEWEDGLLGGVEAALLGHGAGGIDGEDDAEWEGGVEAELTAETCAGWPSTWTEKDACWRPVTGCRRRRGR
jgi:hypothetical protein